MIYPTKQDFIAHLRTLPMEATVVITADHGTTVTGIVTHTLPATAIHTVRFSYPKAEPERTEFGGPEWHWPAGIMPDVRDGTHRLTRDELIFQLVDHTPIREYGVTLALAREDWPALAFPATGQNQHAGDNPGKTTTI